MRVVKGSVDGQLKKCDQDNVEQEAPAGAESIGAVQNAPSAMWARCGGHRCGWCCRRRARYSRCKDGLVHRFVAVLLLGFWVGVGEYSCLRIGFRCYGS